MISGSRMELPAWHSQRQTGTLFAGVGRSAFALLPLAIAS
jgi:hypothetical protein